MQSAAMFGRVMMRQAIAIPDPNARKHHDADEREQGKPHDGFLTAGDDSRRRKQRTERAARVSPNLENRLGTAGAPALAQVCDARGFGMKDCRTDPDESDCEEDELKVCRDRE